MRRRPRRLWNDGGIRDGSYTAGKELAKGMRGGGHRSEWQLRPVDHGE